MLGGDFTESRNTFAVIDVRNYIHNLEYFQEKCAPAKVMPVIKANAYGHGAVMLAKSAEKWGIDYFAVAFLEEAIELRKNGISSDILVFNYVEPDFLTIAVENNITITMYSWEQLEKYSVVSKKPKVHVNVDTGMNRVGIKPQHVKDYIFKLKQDGFNVEGLYTHFAVADSDDIEDIKFTEQQYKLFEAIDVDVSIKHVCNSAAAIAGRIPCHNYVRVGIAGYGLMPGKRIYRNLKPVLSWKTAVSHVKYIEKGESISYGRTFVADKRMKVATIPVGYADGYWRHLSNKGEVLIRGKRCRILGRVCMDQFVVDVSHLENVNSGDEVVLIGEQLNENISAEEIAELVGTINYEVTCRISERVPRIYRGVEL
ncbi:alanine racemase [Thermosipho ferrireducens]|uniref:Alanine racemase n=1 Tax=Thermosipho ferrireducens TaxID=2571116 RepID=A0ABX7S7B2_9BACT|nr:alanine racemase [Thermosipho ferrireducens]QTA37156.1 alanine racemase [Thermosipho ferrireducens]